MTIPGSIHRVKNCSIGLGPTEWSGHVFVVGFDVAVNLPEQILDAGEDTVVDGSPVELREPRFDCVEPGSASWREVVPVLFGRESAAVARDQMQVEIGRDRPNDLPEEGKKLPGELSRTPQHLSGRDVEGGGYVALFPQVDGEAAHAKRLGDRSSLSQRDKQSRSKRFITLTPLATKPSLQLRPIRLRQSPRLSPWIEQVTKQGHLQGLLVAGD